MNKEWRNAIVMILIVIALTTALCFISDIYSDPQSPVESGWQDMNDMTDNSAELVELNFIQYEGDVKDLLSNWNDSSEPDRYYDIMLPCFCGNTTEIRYNIGYVKKRLNNSVNLSESSRIHLENMEWRTKKSIEAGCLPSRYSNLLLGMNLSVDAIDHTDTMLDMIDSGNASYEEVYSEAEAARDCYRQAAHKYIGAECGYSSDWHRETLRMRVYAYSQGDRLDWFMEAMQSDENVSTIICINTDRTRWGFCDE